MVKGSLIQTPREKKGSVDGINLFFGALLGANLGATGALPLYDYVYLIVVLAATVMTLRVFALSERRRYAWTLLGGYLVFVALFLFLPDVGPDALDQASLNRLAATLGVWLVMILLIELMPTVEPVESGVERSMTEDDGSLPK
jgi:hypothetical protein